MPNEATYEELLHAIEQNGVYVEKEIHGLQFPNIDTVVPHLVLLLCLRGHALHLYDMQEEEIGPNALSVILPGHVLRQVECSDDFTYARIGVSKELFEDLNSYIFTHDYEKFHASPSCLLTDLQTKRIMALAELIEAVASHTIKDLQLRRQMLLAQLAIAYEFINYYRREQDLPRQQNRSATIFAEFCDLVTKHYRENRNVNFYAEKLGYDPRYFSKLFLKQSNGMTALEWIQRYIATRAKHVMDEHPNQTVKEVAYQLGFPTTANFCRYFKRSTGIYPLQYKKSVER